MSIGSFYAISTLLNQIVSSYYKNENEKIGMIGLILVLSVLIGSIFGGVILDKTKKYKYSYIISLINREIKLTK